MKWLYRLCLVVGLLFAASTVYASELPAYDAETFQEDSDPYDANQWRELLDGSYSIFTSGDWAFTVMGEKACLLGYNGSSLNIVIPSSVSAADSSGQKKTYTVTALDQIFQWNDTARENVKSVTIPSTITYIYLSFFQYESLQSVTFEDGTTPLMLDRQAFSNCWELTQIDLPKRLRVLGFGSFYNDNLTSIELPEGVTTLGTNCFAYNTKLTKVGLPTTLVAIEDRAFEFTGVKALHFPESLQEIGSAAFHGCEGLKYVIFDGDAPTIAADAFDGVNCVAFYPANNTTWTAKRRKNYSGDLNWVPIDGEASIHEACSGEIVVRGYRKSTCQKEGYSGDICCKDCGGIIAHGASIPISSHEFKTVTTPATFSRDGTIANKCKTCGYVKSQKTIPYLKTVRLETNSQTYTRDYTTPRCIIKDRKGHWIDNAYYMIEVPELKGVGTYKITVRFRGNYSGKKQLTYKVNPEAAEITAITPTSKGILVKWKKIRKQATGYEIQWCKSSRFKKNVGKKKITSYRTTSLKIPGISISKEGYVRIRTYKTVNKVNYYSEWDVHSSKLNG